jgi:hypothetical protein
VRESTKTIRDSYSRDKYFALIRRCLVENRLIKPSKIIAFFLCVALAAQTAVRAFETDQYNLPPAPLADIGDEVSEYVEEKLRKAVDKINRQIAARVGCLEKGGRAKGCDAPEKERAELARLRSESAIVKEVFKPLGGGFPPFTRSGSWMEAHRFRAQPARYKTSFADSIYRTFPTNYLTISETVKIYGVEFGTDKIAHIFQQGYTYYKICERAAAAGASPAEAERRAIRWGQMTERTFYGYLVSGVYSNGDLAANFAGLRFYQNLTRAVKIGGETRPPILILKNGFWAFGDAATRRENLLKPFVSNHLNEALNPSIYVKLFWLDSVVRRTVETKSCVGWREKYPDSTQTDYARITENLKLWHGEDYGFKSSDHFITIAGACFGDGKEKAR